MLPEFTQECGFSRACFAGKEDAYAGVFGIFPGELKLVVDVLIFLNLYVCAAGCQVCIFLSG